MGNYKISDDVQKIIDYIEAEKKLKQDIQDARHHIEETISERTRFKLPAGMTDGTDDLRSHLPELDDIEYGLKKHESIEHLTTELAKIRKDISETQNGWIAAYKKVLNPKKEESHTEIAQTSASPKELIDRINVMIKDADDYIGNLPEIYTKLPKQIQANKEKEIVYSTVKHLYDIANLINNNITSSGNLEDIEGEIGRLEISIPRDRRRRLEVFSKEQEFLKATRDYNMGNFTEEGELPKYPPAQPKGLEVDDNEYHLKKLSIKVGYESNKLLADAKEKIKSLQKISNTESKDAIDKALAGLDKIAYIQSTKKTPQESKLIDKALDDLMAGLERNISEIKRVSNSEAQNAKLRPIVEMLREEGFDEKADELIRNLEKKSPNIEYTDEPARANLVDLELLADNLQTEASRTEELRLASIKVRNKLPATQDNITFAGPPNPYSKIGEINDRFDKEKENNKTRSYVRNSPEMQAHTDKNVSWRHVLANPLETNVARKALTYQKARFFASSDYYWYKISGNHIFSKEDLALYKGIRDVTINEMLDANMTVSAVGTSLFRTLPLFKTDPLTMAVAGMDPTLLLAGPFGKIGFKVGEFAAVRLAEGTLAHTVVRGTVGSTVSLTPALIIDTGRDLSGGHPWWYGTAMVAAVVLPNKYVPPILSSINRRLPSNVQNAIGKLEQATLPRASKVLKPIGRIGPYVAIGSIATAAVNKGTNNNEQGRDSQ